MKYYIRSRYKRTWHEVTEDRYNEYREALRKMIYEYAQNIPYEEKEQEIQRQWDLYTKIFWQEEITMALYDVKVTSKYNGIEIFKQLEYYELVNRIKCFEHRWTRWTAINYLIGFNGCVTEKDVENIMRAYREKIID